jgi:hypothetical protein
VQVDNIEVSELTEQYTAYTLGPGAVNFAAMLRGAGVPFGCQVPVAVTASGVAANTVNIAFTSVGTACR